MHGSINIYTLEEKKELPKCYITNKEIPENAFKYPSWEVNAFISAEGLAILEIRAKNKKDKEAQLLWSEWQWTSDLQDMT